MKNPLALFLIYSLSLLAGCASLPGSTPDPTGTLIALQVIQAGTSLATNNCVTLAAPDVAAACTLPPGASQAQQQATVAQCFTASILQVVIARHRTLFCPTAPPVVVVPAPTPVIIAPAAIEPPPKPKPVQ